MFEVMPLYIFHSIPPVEPNSSRGSHGRALLSDVWSAFAFYHVRLGIGRVEGCLGAKIPSPGSSYTRMHMCHMLQVHVQTHVYKNKSFHICMFSFLCVSRGRTNHTRLDKKNKPSTHQQPSPAAPLLPPTQETGPAARRFAQLTAPLGPSTPGPAAPSQIKLGQSRLRFLEVLP